MCMCKCLFICVLILIQSVIDHTIGDWEDPYRILEKNVKIMSTKTACVLKFWKVLAFLLFNFTMRNDRLPLVGFGIYEITRNYPASQQLLYQLPPSSDDKGKKLLPEGCFWNFEKMVFLLFHKTSPCGSIGHFNRSIDWIRNYRNNYLTPNQLYRLKFHPTDSFKLQCNRVVEPFVIPSQTNNTKSKPPTLKKLTFPSLIIL